MFKNAMVSAAVAAGALFAVSAQAETLQTGRSTYVHHHHHAAHHYHMTYGAHNRTRYGVGSGIGHRTTATGGNPGGYSSRN